MKLQWHRCILGSSRPRPWLVGTLSRPLLWTPRRARRYRLSARLRVRLLLIIVSVVLYYRNEQVSIQVFPGQNGLTALNTSHFYYRREVQESDVTNFAAALIQSCPGSHYKMNDTTSSKSTSIPRGISKLLTSSVSQTFILTGQDKCSLVGIGAVCVMGKKIDSCIPEHLSFLTGAHGYAASLTHAAVLAFSHHMGYKSVAIVEDDAVLRDVDGTTIYHLMNLAASHRWDIIRLGYRPFFLESKSEKYGYVCPQACYCTPHEEFSDELCQISAAGCDLRSADFYLARNPIFLELCLKLLDYSEEQHVIDWSVLQSFHNNWILTPQISFQSKLETIFPIDLQVGFGRLFRELCVRAEGITMNGS